MKLPKFLNDIIIDVLYKNYLFYLECGGENVSFNDWLCLYREFLSAENFQDIYNLHLEELKILIPDKKKKKKGK